MATDQKLLWLALYVRVTADRREEFIEEAFANSTRCVVGVQLEFFQVMNPDMARFSRLRRLTPPGFANLVKQYASGSVDDVLAYDRSMQPSTPSTEPLFILAVGGEGYNNIQSVTLTVSQKVYNQKALIGYLRGLVGSFPPEYGCACSGLASGSGRSVCTLTPTVSLDGLLNSIEKGITDTPELKSADEVEFYQKHRELLGEKIPRACWGNILSHAHIEGLGGEERIRDESGCYLVERWGENLYLQLTESPWDVSKEQLLALNRYFEPIRFPGAPEPVYLEEP